MLDGGEDANLVEGVLLFFKSQVVDVNFLHRVLLPVGETLDLVDTRVGSRTCVS